VTQALHRTNTQRTNVKNTVEKLERYLTVSSDTLHYIVEYAIVIKHQRHKYTIRWLQIVMISSV